MKQDKIPFSIELFQKGYRAVNKEGNEYYGIRLTTDPVYVGYIPSETGMVRLIHIDDLFLLPPEDEINEIVVEVEWNENKVAEDFTLTWPVLKTWTKNFPPGKYRLTKID